MVFSTTATYPEENMSLTLVHDTKDQAGVVSLAREIGDAAASWFKAEQKRQRKRRKIAKASRKKNRG